MKSEIFEQIVLPQEFTILNQKLLLNQNFKKAVQNHCPQFEFKRNKLQSLNPQKVKKSYKNILYKTVVQNSYSEESYNNQGKIWFENQLRIFVWIVCGYLYIESKNVRQLTIMDFRRLHTIFPHKQAIHLEYQIKLLTRNKNIKWSLQQQEIFKQIMRQNPSTKKWNFVAKQMYILSNKKCFKTPKQCRQRWINHVNPHIIKGQWSQQQDYVLLESALKKGKKWTLISKALQNSRTENCVKNRYNAIIKLAKKQIYEDQDELTIVELLYQKMKSNKLSKTFHFDQNLKRQAQIDTKFENYQKIQQQHKVSSQKNISNHSNTDIDDRNHKKVEELSLINNTYLLHTERIQTYEDIDEYWNSQVQLNKKNQVNNNLQPHNYSLFDYHNIDSYLDDCFIEKQEFII